MKKNITINMFGQLYAIDEDAYELLERYLSSMKRYFSDKEGGEEIADDIEHRVAELLWQQKEEGTMAISIEVVKEIISKIGNPTEIDSAEENGDKGERIATDNHEETMEAEVEKPDNGLFGWRKGRDLYRNPKDKVFGGVCSGLAQFTGKGTSLVWRLGTLLALFLFLALGQYMHISFAWMLILLYIILWIIVPLPRTPEDRLRMKGHDVTPKNINEEIINESVSGSAEEYRPGNSQGGCLLLGLKLILVLCALPLIFAFAFGLFIIIMVCLAKFHVAGAMFPYLAVGNMTWFPEYVQDNAATIICATISSIAVIGIPIYCFVRVLRSSSKPMSTSGIVSCVFMWILSLVIAVISITSTVMTCSKAGQDYRDQMQQADITAQDTAVMDPLPTDSSAVDTIGF